MLEIYNKFRRCRKMIRIIKYKAARRPKIKNYIQGQKVKESLRTLYSLGVETGDLVGPMGLRLVGPVK